MPSMTNPPSAVRRLQTVNVLSEHSRLAPESLARWQGLALGWFDAAATVSHREPFVTRPLLALLDSGEAQARFDFGTGLKTYELHPGALRVFDGQRVCRRNEWSCRSARRIMLDLDATRIGEPDALPGLQQDLDFRDDALAGLLRAMVREVAEGCPHGALYAESLSIAVLLRLRRTHAASRGERGALSAPQLRRVDDLIAAEPGAGPTLAALAATTGYSKSQFVRLFRRATGTSPHRYVLDARLRRARRLIETSPLSLAAIAFETGFASQSHLTNAFVRHFGCTPGTARRTAGH
jgi:AraC family transcriptional regulator